ncbi:MAG: tRNA (adenosine(37)-N6)-threonylcarbamoyltransferase complex dimerization subunit type 1 TsaB [Bacilli bacterium]
MITLLLDSSNKNLSVALARDNQVFAKKDYEAWQQQSERMIPEIDGLLKAANLTTKEIANIVVAIGPGSYTGVRIAVTIAKIMAFLIEAKLYKVSSLAVLADHNLPTICLANARSNRSYFAVYQGVEAIVEDTIISNDEVMAYIEAHQNYAVAGEASYLGLTSIQSNRFDAMLRFIDEKHEVKDLLALKPIYLKD